MKQFFTNLQTTLQQFLQQKIQLKLFFFNLILKQLKTSGRNLVSLMPSTSIKSVKFGRAASTSNKCSINQEATTLSSPVIGRSHSMITTTLKKQHQSVLSASQDEESKTPTKVVLEKNLNPFWSLGMGQQMPPPATVAIGSIFRKNLPQVKNLNLSSQDMLDYNEEKVTVL